MSTTPEPPSSEDEPPSIPDEVWAKFSEDTYGKIRASAPKEPSARARMVTERLRREDAEAAQRKARRPRFGRKARNTGEPQGWRTGPAWQEMRREAQGPWRRRVRALLIVAVVAVVAAIAMNPTAALSFIRGGGIPRTTTLPPETAPPTAAPPAAPGTATLQHPFAGSPAEAWANGADGIVLPQAKAVGTLTQSQVAAALQETKEFLVASNLDPATLRGQYPQAAIDLIDPRDTSTRDGMQTALRTPSKQHDPLSWFTRYNPKQLKLVGNAIKVRGEMTFSEGQYATVKVHADYTFVYPFTQVNGGTGEVSRTIVRRVLDFQVDGGKLSLTGADGDVGNSACDVNDGYVHPSFSTGGVSGHSPTGPTTDPYDRSKPLPPDEKCGIATRT